MFLETVLFLRGLAVLNIFLATPASLVEMYCGSCNNVGVTENERANVPLIPIVVLLEPPVSTKIANVKRKLKVLMWSALYALLSIASPSAVSENHPDLRLPGSSAHSTAEVPSR